FDLERVAVTGPAAPVLEGVSTDPGFGNARISIARDGRARDVEAAADDLRSLVWVDRRGATLSVVGPPRAFSHPSLSPDGKRVVVQVADGSPQDLWIRELASGALSRFTSESPSIFPVWTPDGERVVFSGRVDGKGALRSQAIDASSPIETLVH